MINKLSLLLCIIAVLLISGCISGTTPSGTKNYTPSETPNIQPRVEVSMPQTQPEINITEHYTTLKFYNGTCLIDGKITLNVNVVGETINGYYNFSRINFETIIRPNNILCLQGTIPECFNHTYAGWRLQGCWLLDDSYFEDGTEIPLEFGNISPRWPAYCYEYTNFVKPEYVSNKIENWRDIKMFNNISNIDVEFLWHQVESNVQIFDDFRGSGDWDYWKLPNETWGGQGDCDDWSNLLVSLIKAYNKSLKCYAVALLNHVTTVCKFDQDPQNIQYIFYDEGEVIKRGFNRVELYDYFNLYDIPQEYRQVTCAYDDNNYFEFNSNEEFIQWLEGI